MKIRGNKILLLLLLFNILLCIGFLKFYNFIDLEEVPIFPDFIIITFPFNIYCLTLNIKFFYFIKKDREKISITIVYLIQHYIVCSILFYLFYNKELLYFFSEYHFKSCKIYIEDIIQTFVFNNKKYTLIFFLEFIIPIYYFIFLVKKIKKADKNIKL
ncbi:hypothetical protein CBG58_02845 [Fusobacterium polymorphum]|nr:hypothetical protein CBG58_02845 [Fusobacterium polymorphum]